MLPYSMTQDERAWAGSSLSLCRTSPYAVTAMSCGLRMLCAVTASPVPSGLMRIVVPPTYT